MNFSRRNAVVNTGFGLALSILVVIGSLYYVNVTAMTEFDRMEERTFAVTLELQSLLTAMKDVEIGELAFILTGDEDSLEPYRTALAQIEASLTKLKSLTKNLPTEQNRVYSVESLIREKLAEVAETMVARKTEGFRVAYQREFAYQHEQTMEEARRQLAAAREAVSKHLNNELALKADKTRVANLTFFTGGGISCALLISSFLILRRDIARRKRAEENVDRLNSSLAERASELETANRELEAFNFTVSHDLRQPLNLINSSCQAIKEQCGDKLCEECLNYLQDSYDSTMRMNRLIDALLKFSSLSSVKLCWEPVDLSVLAHEVAAELKLLDPERWVTFRIADGIVAKGDTELLRVVLHNLLGNAWKYTSAQKNAVIEFGVIEIDDGKQCYFARDNGRGFDMADATELFVAFKRLPGAEEFRGFGIGLATVERIIGRHGGRVWAEGEPGKGAVFYFTL